MFMGVESTCTYTCVKFVVPLLIRYIYVGNGYWRCFTEILTPCARFFFLLPPPLREGVECADGESSR